MRDKEREKVPDLGFTENGGPSKSATVTCLEKTAEMTRKRIKYRIIVFKN